MIMKTKLGNDFIIYEGTTSFSNWLLVGDPSIGHIGTTRQLMGLNLLGTEPDSVEENNLLIGPIYLQRRFNWQVFGDMMPYVEAITSSVSYSTFPYGTDMYVNNHRYLRLASNFVVNLDNQQNL